MPIIYSVWVKAELQPPISDKEKKKIIDYYLQGVRPQSSIATLVGRSEGTVSNIIRGFLDQAGEQNTEAIRDLVLAMSKEGVQADDCVRGFRIIQMLSRMGITLDNERDRSWIIKLESFIGEVYKVAESIELPGDRLAEYTKQLLEVSKDQSIDPAHVAEFCSSKQKELGETTKELEVLEDRRRKAMEDSKVTEADLQQFRYVREELQKRDLAIDDVPKLVNALKNAEQLDHNASRIAVKISEVESIEKKKQDDIKLDLAISNDIVKHDKELDAVKKQLAAKNEILAELNQLEDMGCGLDQLKVLRETVSGIVAAHELVVELGVTGSNQSNRAKLTPREAFRKFISDVEKDYDKVMGFEFVIDEEARLRAKIQTLNGQIPLVSQVVDSLGKKVEQIESAAKNLHRDSEIIESCKREVTETKQAFKDLRQMVQPIYQETGDLIRQCRSIVSSNTENYRHSLALLRVKAKNFQKIIRALAGEQVPVEELAMPVIWSLDAIIPRLDDTNEKTKCEQARSALQQIIGGGNVNIL